MFEKFRKKVVYGLQVFAFCVVNIISSTVVFEPFEDLQISLF